MKKITFMLILAIVACSAQSLNAQSIAKYRAERDSVYALYIFVLEKYDSVLVSHAELAKKMEQTGAQIAGLKTELESILLKRKQAQEALEEAKKLITDLVSKVDELEAEVKRLSQTKKKQ